MEFCKDVKEWLNSDSENVVAIHCKGGKGEVSCDCNKNDILVHACIYMICFSTYLTYIRYKMVKLY